jgi:hypothetical protein
MPRLVFLAGVGVVLVAAAFTVADQAVHAVDRVTLERCARIRFGMTPREVELLLGRPADQSAPSELTDQSKVRTHLRGMVDQTLHGHSWSIRVRYLREAVVLRAYCWPAGTRCWSVSALA